MSKPVISKLAAKHELWRRANLRFKCHSVQADMYDKFYSSERRSVSVWLLARQSGKSVLLAILALEHALREPHTIVKLVTDTKIHVKTIFEKIFIELLDDCPDDLKPTYSKAEFTYYFNNGSQLQMAGSDGKNYERLRGQKCKLVLVDEAGFCDDLDNMIKSVLIPTTTHTGGKIVLASTPPEDETHDFLRYIEEAELNNRLTVKTLFDNPLLPDEEKRNIIQMMGGAQTERFRREYLCELVKNTSSSVVPEFNADLEAMIVKEWPKPPFFDSYVSMDLGFHDMTALIFGYYDFRADKIIIEDELPFHFNEKDQTIKTLIEQIRAKERKLWTNPLSQELKEPYLRVSDVDPIILKEIYTHSDGEISFIGTRKDNKEAMINEVRTMLAAKKIIINPKCTTLIRHLKNVKKHKTKNEFARSVDNSHYDMVDALIYLCRNIQFSKNPYPHGYDLNLKREDAFIRNPAAMNNNSSIDVFKKLLGPNRKRS